MMKNPCVWPGFEENIFSDNEGLWKNYLCHLLVKLGKTFDYSLLRSLFFRQSVPVAFLS